MTALEPAAAPPRAPWWRYLLRSPLAWAALCGGIAAPLYQAGLDAEFWGFLLTIVAGWLCGLSFVNATVRLQPYRRGVILHIVGAVAAWLLLVLAMEVVPRLVPDGAPRALFAVLQLALVPAAGWVWLTLIGRITSAFRIRSDASAAAKPPRPAPAWEGDGEGAVLCFTAVRMRMRTLGVAIAGVVVVVAGMGLAILISLDRAGVHLGPRMAIVAMGLLLGFPAYLLLAALIRARSIDCAVRVVRGRLRIEAGAERYDLAFREIDLLRWRTDTEYARVEARGRGVDISLLAGLAKPPTDRSPQLPALSPRVVGLLEDAGLTVERSRQGLLTLRRGRDGAEHQHRADSSPKSV